MMDLKYDMKISYKRVLAWSCFTIFAFIGLMAQNLKVKGNVQDTDGKYISFAIIGNGDVSDTADIRGNFEITTNKGTVLNVRKSGYQNRIVKAYSALTVVLQPLSGEKNVELLFESRKDKEVTSSVSTLSSDRISHNSVLALGNGLYGQIPGLNVHQADGEPGDDYPSLLIRGKHTFTGSNSPLVLVDGFEREYNTLSTEEVESISVLKDAAATALYGMDGANGVLLVTTKRGLPGKTTIGLKVETGVKSPTRLPSFYGSYDYARFYDMAQKNDGKTTLLYSDAQLEGYRLHKDPLLYPDVDWFSETLRPYSPSSKYALDFRGGNETAKFYVNVGLENAEGMFKNSDHGSYSTNRNLDRMNFRSNIDVKVTNRFSIRLDLAGRLENLNEPTNSSAVIFNNLYTFHPNVAPVFVGDGIYGGTNTYRNNPVAYINEMGYKQTHRRYFQSNIMANYDLSDFVKGLSAGFRATFDNFYTVTDGYSKTFAVSQITDKANPIDSVTVYGINGNLTALGPGTESEYRRSNLEFYSNYNRSFGKHKIDAMIMYHQDDYVTGPDFPNRRMSVSGKLSYGYNQKYFVDLAANYGASENFIAGRRFGLFPAVSGAWIASSESFLKEVSAISYLKLRASTGLVGNQNVGGTRFGYRNLYSSAGVEQTAGNPYLTWEKAYKTDLGVDLTLFKNIQLMFTYFNEFRDDILNSGDASIPTYFGNSFGYTNYGQVKSSGFEASLSHERHFISWGYHIGANITAVRNTVTRNKEITRKYPYLYTLGQQIGQRYGLIALGLFQSQAEIDAAPTQSWGKVIPGSIRYKDVNGDGVVNSDDLTPIGKDATVPDFDLGFNLGFNIGGFYVDANFQTAIGRQVNLRDGTEGALYCVTPLYGDKNVSTFVKNPWTPETAATADYPSLSIENAANNYQYSTYWLRNGDFLRLRSLEIGYNLPKRWITNVKLSSANIYLRGMNVFTWDHIGYFDPEVMEGYPVMKSYNIGINFKF